MCAAAFGIPGLIGAYHPSWVSNAAIQIYHAGWIICFAVAASFYYAINVFLPARVYPDGIQRTTPMKFEELADSEGYLEGESIIAFITSKDDETEKSDKV